MRIHAGWTCFMRPPCFCTSLAGGVWGIIHGMKNLFLTIGCAAAFALTARGAQKIVIEAETASAVEAPFAVVAADTPGMKPGASGGYLEIPPGKGKPPEDKEKIAKAVFNFEVAEEGSFVLWLRVWCDGECNNSFNAKFDDGPRFLIGEDPTFKVWKWVKYPVPRNAPLTKLAAGSHTLTLYHRQDGIRVDQILLTTDKRYVPVEIEK